jgi:hypothetical protein
LRASSQFAKGRDGAFLVQIHEIHQEVIRMNDLDLKHLAQMGSGEVGDVKRDDGICLGDRAEFREKRNKLATMPENPDPLSALERRASSQVFRSAGATCNLARSPAKSRGQVCRGRFQ